MTPRLIPHSWKKALQSSCEFVGSVSANLFWQDATAEQVVTLHQSNDDPHFTRLYHEVYAPLNPVFPAAFFQDVGRVTAATDLVPRRELEDTRFFKEWIAPQGLGDSLGIVLEKEAQRAAFLTFQGVSGFVTDDTRRRASLLVPHFQRAVVIGRLFAQNETTTAAFAQTLDHVEAGVFLVASNERIVFSNAAGRRMIEAGALFREARGVLRATASGSDRDLKESLRAIEQGRLLGGLGASVSLSDDAGERWSATVLPLIDGARRRTGEAYEAIAAVFVRNSIRASPVPLEMLAKRYRLTASEIRVAEAMLRVTGVDAIAEMLGISRSTVKTHLNHILRKCDARNQNDLIKLISGFAP